MGSLTHFASTLPSLKFAAMFLLTRLLLCCYQHSPASPLLLPSLFPHQLLFFLFLHFTTHSHTHTHQACGRVRAATPAAGDVLAVAGVTVAATPTTDADADGAEDGEDVDDTAQPGTENCFASHFL